MRSADVLLKPRPAGRFVISSAPRSSAAPPAPAWWAPIAAIVAAAGGYLWVHEEGIAEGLEAPVSAWFDVTGVRSFAQPGVSSIRPTRKAAAVRFDGVDDRLNGDTELPTWLARTSGPWTVGVGSPLCVSSAAGAFWSATSGSTASIVNLLTNNVLGRAGGSTLFSTPIVDTGPVSSWITVAGAGANLAKRRVSGVEALGSYGTQTAGIVNFTLGGRRTTTPGVFANADISWVIVCPAALSSADMAAIEAVFLANGYPV